MKFTDMIRRAEELQMVYTLFRRTLSSQAQTEALLEVAREAQETEQVTKLEGQLSMLKKRLDAIGTITHRMLGSLGEDDLVAAMDKLGAYMERHSRLRSDQAMLRLEAEISGMNGYMSSEARLQYEKAQTDIKTELEFVAGEVEKLFPKPTMVTL